MTPEQIKVLKELRDDGVLAGCIDVEEQKALTAALKFIEDMRELEAVTVQITIVSGDLPDRGVKAHDIFNVGDGWIYNDKRFNSRCEAYAAVKGGKD